MKKQLAINSCSICCFPFRFHQNWTHLDALQRLATAALSHLGQGEALKHCQERYLTKCLQQLKKHICAFKDSGSRWALYLFGVLCAILTNQFVCQQCLILLLLIDKQCKAPSWHHLRTLYTRSRTYMTHQEVSCLCLFVRNMQEAHSDMIFGSFVTCVQSMMASRGLKIWNCTARTKIGECATLRGHSLTGQGMTGA